MATASNPRSVTMRALAAVLAIVAAATLAPFWAPLVLAAWIADLLSPVVHRLERAFGGRRRGAAAVAVLLTIALLMPLVGAAFGVAAAVRDLVEQVRAAVEGRGTVTGMLLGSGPSGPTFRDWADFASRYGANAWIAVSMIARASASVILGLLVFLVGLYEFAVDGDRAYRWLEQNAPIPKDAFARLARAFRETGRGLIIGTGGTALVQGALATVAYIALGLPRPLVLGLLTALCAPVPLVGTSLVWGPLAIELALAHDYVRAGVMLAVGLGVLSLIDNVVRPILTRRARLELPTFVVLLSMIGGVITFGATGALLGPLLVRLAVEALSIVRETRALPDEVEEPESLPRRQRAVGEVRDSAELKPH
jgi:predicted PurR-regulated permease PerM